MNANAVVRDIDAIIAERNDLAAEVERLRAIADQAIREIASGHNHWDLTMRYGQGCETCIHQREITVLLRAALDGTP